MTCYIFQLQKYLFNLRQRHKEEPMTYMKTNLNFPCYPCSYIMCSIGNRLVILCHSVTNVVK